MSFDIIQEIYKKYTIPVELDNNVKSIVNESSRNESQDIDDFEFNNRTIKSSSNDKFISDYVCSSYYDSNLHGEVNSNLFYIYKTNGNYKYEKEKPFEYNYISYSDFLKEITNIEVITASKNILKKSIKLKKLSRKSYGDDTSKSLYYIFDSPYGGLIEGSCYLFTEIDGFLKPIDLSLKINNLDSVIIDYIEGKVYINNLYPDVVRDLYMYTDIAPLKIYQNKSYSPTESTEVFGKFVQKGTEGLIDIYKISDIEFILTMSYNSFIVSSDPYFIEVDGIALLNPRVVPKNTPIYVKQSFTHNIESFLEEYYNFYLSREIFNTSISGTHIQIDSSIDTGDLVSGLFIYDYDENSSLDNKPNYIPLFKKQNYIKE